MCPMPSFTSFSFLIHEGFHTPRIHFPPEPENCSHLPLESKTAHTFLVLHSSINLSTSSEFPDTLVSLCVICCARFSSRCCSVAEAERFLTMHLQLGHDSFKFPPAAPLNVCDQTFFRSVLELAEELTLPERTHILVHVHRLFMMHEYQRN